jgi:hypothetical protein
MPANEPEYFAVEHGHKIAAIRATADGVLHVTEMTR